MDARRFRVEGRVQGVFFRDWTVRTAQALGLTGWVRNRRDGSVEVFAQGTAEALAQLEEELGEGPLGARVERVVGEAAVPTGAEGFTRAPTG